MSDSKVHIYDEPRDLEVDGVGAAMNRGFSVLPSFVRDHLDADGDGVVTKAEMESAVLTMKDKALLLEIERKENNMMKRLVALLSVLLLLAVTAMVVATLFIVDGAKDTDTTGSVMTSRDTNQPVQTSNFDMVVEDGVLYPRQGGGPSADPADSTSTWGPLPLPTFEIQVDENGDAIPSSAFQALAVRNAYKQNVLRSTLPDKYLRELKTLELESDSGATMIMTVLGVARVPHSKALCGSFLKIMTIDGTLLVDDDQLYFDESAANIFSQAGYASYQATNGRRSLRELDASKHRGFRRLQDTSVSIKAFFNTIEDYDWTCTSVEKPNLPAIFSADYQVYQACDNEESDFDGCEMTFGKEVFDALGTVDREGSRYMLTTRKTFATPASTTMIDFRVFHPGAVTVSESSQDEDGESTMRTYQINSDGSISHCTLEEASYKMEIPEDFLFYPLGDTDGNMERFRISYDSTALMTHADEFEEPMWVHIDYFQDKTTKLPRVVIAGNNIVEVVEMKVGEAEMESFLDVVKVMMPSFDPAVALSTSTFRSCIKENNKYIEAAKAKTDGVATYSYNATNSSGVNETEWEDYFNYTNFANYSQYDNSTVYYDNSTEFDNFTVGYNFTESSNVTFESADNMEDIDVVRVFTDYPVDATMPPALMNLQYLSEYYHMSVYYNETTESNIDEGLQEEADYLVDGFNEFVEWYEEQIEGRNLTSLSMGDEEEEEEVDERRLEAVSGAGQDLPEKRNTLLSFLQKHSPEKVFDNSTYYYGQKSGDTSAPVAIAQRQLEEYCTKEYRYEFGGIVIYFCIGNDILVQGSEFLTVNVEMEMKSVTVTVSLRFDHSGLDFSSFSASAEGTYAGFVVFGGSISPDPNNPLDPPTGCLGVSIDAGALVKKRKGIVGKFLRSAKKYIPAYEILSLCYSFEDRVNKFSVQNAQSSSKNTQLVTRTQFQDVSTLEATFSTYIFGFIKLYATGTYKLYDKTIVIEEKFNYISSGSNAIASEGVVFKHAGYGRCFSGNSIRTYYQVTGRGSCETKCRNTDSCRGYNYKKSDRMCYLKASSETYACDSSYVSARKEDYWHAEFATSSKSYAKVQNPNSNASPQQAVDFCMNICAESSKCKQISMNVVHKKYPHLGPNTCYLSSHTEDHHYPSKYGYPTSYYKKPTKVKKRTSKKKQKVVWVETYDHTKKTYSGGSALEVVVGISMKEVWYAFWGGWFSLYKYKLIPEQTDYGTYRGKTQLYPTECRTQATYRRIRNDATKWSSVGSRRGVKSNYPKGKLDDSSFQSKCGRDHIAPY